MHYFKRIYDSVHGFIYFSSLERDLIDSYVLQRLHYLHQVGVAYLVYPGATHTRFEHSLGVMHVATQIFDQIMRNYDKPLEPSFLSYWRQVVRFAALCHDLGHLPFSHTAEKFLLEDGGHERWTLSLIDSSFLHPIWERFQLEFPDANVIEDIQKISLGKKKLSEVKKEEVSFSSWENVLSQVITGDFFGADRIDYLLRDARSTGVSYGLFDYHQLIETLRILPFEGDSLTLGIEENGIQSCEALLLARHFMHKRVYQYPSVRAYSLHMARFIQKMYREKKVLSSLENYLAYTDNEVLAEVRAAFLNQSHEGHEDATALLAKGNRYQVLELSSQIEPKDILNWKIEFQIKDEELVLMEQKKEPSVFSFPVLSSHDKIIDAKSCFSISIPSNSSAWVFVAPHHKKLIQMLLETYPLEKSYAKN